MYNPGEIATFDVFDTTITRLWFLPGDLFFDVGLSLTESKLISMELGVWVDMRKKAEDETRRIVSGEDVTLSEIYDQLARQIGWSNDELEKAIQQELSVELACIQTIAETVQKIKLLRAQGTKVVFISDSYFDRNVIRELLGRCGVDCNGSELFVSSEHRLTKASGRLFSVVADSLKTTPDNLVHFGDNPYSDDRSAQRTGLRTIPFKRQMPTRYERLYYALPNRTTIERSILAGSVRAARLGRSFDDPHLQTVWDTTVNVSGPLLYGYVLWVLTTARERGVKRLYFTARDGQVLLRIANAIIEHFGWTIDCRYLYASRQSWHLPSLVTIDKEDLDWILGEFSDRTIRKLFARLELNPSEFNYELKQYGFSPNSWDQWLSNQQLSALSGLICDPEFQELVCANAAKLRGILVDYLRQEGMLDGTPFAIVDIGWHGRLQRSLGKVLKTLPEWKDKTLTGFYFGLRTQPIQSVTGELLAYISSGHCDRNNIVLSSLPMLIEIFCSADHGSTRGFHRTPGGKVQPTLDRSLNSPAIDWGLTTQQEGMLNITSLLLTAGDRARLTPHALIDLLRAATISALLRFAERPSAQEAEVFGRFLAAEDQNHKVHTELAPQLRLGSVLSMMISPGLSYHWIPGTLRRSIRHKLLGNTFTYVYQIRRRLVTTSKSLLRLHS